MSARESVEFLVDMAPGLSAARMAQLLACDVSTVDHHLHRLRRARRALAVFVGRQNHWMPMAVS